MYKGEGNVSLPTSRLSRRSSLYESQLGGLSSGSPGKFLPFRAKPDDELQAIIKRYDIRPGRFVKLLTTEKWYRVVRVEGIMVWVNGPNIRNQTINLRAIIDAGDVPAA